MIIDNFSARRPALHPSQLPAGGAQDANNCVFRAGRLQPLRAAVTDHSQALTPLSLFPYRRNNGSHEWFAWAQDVDVHYAAEAGDTYNRIIWTGQDYPRVTHETDAIVSAPYPSNSWKLGVPAPGIAPTVALNGAEPADPDSELPDTRVYVTTYVNRYGWEGPPSPPSNSLDVYSTQSVDLSNLPTAPVGNYNMLYLRVYRSATGSSGTVLQLVHELPVGTSVFNDAKGGAELGEALETETFEPPPDDMEGLVSLPNGFFAGFAGKTVYMSEPGFPYAWPYQQTLAHEIVALAVYGNNLVALTDSTPYAAVGVHPSSAVLEALEIPQSCTSKRGVVSTGDGIVYPSPDGLVFLSSSGSRMLTEGVISRDQWGADFRPSELRAVLWEGVYLAFHDAGGFAIHPHAPEMGVVDYADSYNAMAYNPETDKMYVATGTQVKRWHDGAAGTFVWRSGQIRTEEYSNFSVAKVVADSYPLTLRYFADGVLKHTQSVTSREPFRLPAGFQAIEHSVELEGSADVLRVHFARGMREIR
ncbi:MAG: hypothetical protein ACPGVG_00485 [Mycobacterium sp.]